MLGLTSYQEALRALGRLAEQTLVFSIVEDAEAGTVEIKSPTGLRTITPAGLEEIVSESLTDRGRHRPAGDRSDVLRAVGQALDQLHAFDVCLELSQTQLRVRFAARHGGFHELTYQGDELEALRRSAAARRNGQPLRRILILEAAPDSAEGLLELLVAEFAVQALPTRYARAMSQGSEPPDLVLAQTTDGTLDALCTLRAGSTADVPLVVLAGPECDLDATELFAAGADDLLHEPVLPAQVRARLRTWLLRGRAIPSPQEPDPW